MRNRLKALFGAQISIGLSKSGVAVIHQQGGWRKQHTLLADHRLAEDAVQSPERLAIQCAAILADVDCAGFPLHITLSDDWVRLFIVTPPQNSGRPQDLQAAAVMRFHALYGDMPNNWHLQADWNAFHPFLACALPRTILAALQQVARECKLDLITVLPQFVTTWNRYRARVQSQSWFGTVQERSLTLGAIMPGKRPSLAAVRTITLMSDEKDAGWLSTQVSRIAMQLDVPVPTQLLLGGNHQGWITPESNPPTTMLAVQGLGEKHGDNPAPGLAISDAVLLARSVML